MATIYQKNGKSVYDQNGQTIDASTGQAISGAPTSSPDPFAPISSSAAEKLSPVTSISTDAGIQALNKAKATETKLSTPPPAPPPDTGNVKPPPTSKVTLINPTTEQSVTFDSADLNKDQIQSYMGSGYQLAEASGNIPSWLKPAQTGTTTPDTTTTALDQAKSELDAAKAKLTGFDVSNDPALKSLLTNISADWDQRISQMENINKSRDAAITTTGVRLGSRYTGGAGGVFGGIISEEERQGVERIANLQRQKQQALAEAKTAYENNQWTRYAKLVDLAQESYNKQLDATKELYKANAEQAAKLKAQETDAKNTNAIATLMKSGVNDPKEILTTLSDLGYSIDSKTLKDSIDALTADNPELKALADARKTLVDNGAPQDVIEAALKENTLAGLYRVAGKYARGGSGIIGEYNFAVANGYTGTPDEYMTEDANRKRQIVNMNAGGLTPQENQTFLTVTNKYQADSVINAAVKAEQIRTLADQIIKNPNSATNQLASLYIFVKNLDPDSAVREGELALANQTQSYLQKFNNSITRLSQGQPLAPAAAKELAQATKDLVATWEKTADKKTKLYRAQASGSSPNVGKAFENYLNDFKTSDTLSTWQNSEQQASDSLKSYISANPDSATEIDSKIKTMESTLGKPISASDFLQAFPEYAQ